jgi:5,6-dimethylbenzimidazole synthase
MADKSFFEVVETRRNIRRYKPEPIPDGHIEKILDAARYAQSGANGQSWEFVVVKDAQLRSKLAQILAEERTEFGTPIEMSRVPEMRHLGSTRGAYGGHIGIKIAPATIIVLGDPRTFQATVLCANYLSGEWDHFHMNIGNCTQIITLAACALGLQGQWVTTFRTAETKMKQLLGIPDIYRIYVVVPIGYPDYDSPPPYRRPLTEIVHYDKFDMSKYRTSEQVQNWIKELRQRTTPHYHVRREPA